jgi:uncharacterized flavoprotein (TIGR03862 family)
MARIAIIGAGPAGLAAAEVLGDAGHSVTVFDHMPSPGRKFLLAGRGGLNLTHSEERQVFLSRYGNEGVWLRPAIEAFGPEDVRAWCEGLGQHVFVGSSGRVFPAAFKAAPLLRAWLRRLEGMGARFEGRHRWLGFGSDGGLRFTTPHGEVVRRADATLLALGGASWPRMGSDGAWVTILRDAGLCVHGLRPANSGFLVAWSRVFLDRFEGVPLKRIEISAGGRTCRGEAVITKEGLEGGAVYAVFAAVREELSRSGSVMIHLDLRPDLSADALGMRLAGDRQGRSLANFLRQRAGLPPVAIGLVQEAQRGGTATASLAATIKALPLCVLGVQPIDQAISSAGGIAGAELDERLMLRRLPGVFAAGEMLDWEAPTGGYLLQACFSTGRWAAHGMLDWVGGTASENSGK